MPIRGAQDINVKTEIISILGGQSGAVTSRAGVKGIAPVVEKVKRMPAYVAKAMKQAMLSVGMKTFEASMQMVPVDTGETAESGRLILNNKTYAKGTFSGGNETGVELMGWRVEEVNATPTAEDFESSIRGKLNLSITFRRENAKGDNIALWLHEDLLPLGEGKSGKSARQEGRSGKFIEAPFNNIFIPAIRREIIKRIAYALKVMK